MCRWEPKRRFFVIFLVLYGIWIEEKVGSRRWAQSPELPHLFFRFYQAGKAEPVPKSPVSSGPFLGFLEWTRLTGWRLPNGLRDMFQAGPQTTQQLCPQLCYLPFSVQNIILTMSFPFSRVQPGAT